ncbi:hypothetical protein PG996_012055 [Apiospora saccharicola]|uniref:Uncharacterized protein n=1 Tax=Apiospora saccharicola TaxID=335842 RepID=A0ABR1U1H4_9PEZI
MRVTLFVTSLIAAVAALPATPAPAGNSALAKRVEFANDDFEIKEEPDFVKRDFAEDDFDITPEPDKKKRTFAEDDFDIKSEPDD